MRLDQKIKPSERVPSLEKPSLQALSYILRHKEHWPQDFKWNYGDCMACAMGMSVELWPKRVEVAVSTFMARAMNMSYEASRRIFAGAAAETFYGVQSHREISPEMVADKIDEYLVGE